MQKILKETFIQENQQVLNAAWFDTPLGAMFAVADEAGLYFLGFADRCQFSTTFERFKKKLQARIILGHSLIIDGMQREIIEYFAGHRTVFETPLYLKGTPFQKKVWQALREVPLGETRAYLEIAKAINHPKAHRAVALANSANHLAVIIPCHRVINSDGKIGGYAGGASRKQWLLAHEKTAISQVDF